MSDPRKQRPRNNGTVSRRRRLRVLPYIAVVGALLAGCGSSSTSSSASSSPSASGSSSSSGSTSSTASTPAYCAAVNNFKSAVQPLGNLKLSLNGVGALLSVFNNVQRTGKAAVAAVKSSFAAQTAALKSSLTSLEAAVSQLANSQTRAAAIAQLPTEIQTAQTTFNGFLSAAKPACG